MAKAAKTTSAGRERLLDAAEMLFAAKGYDGAGIREIARAAGVELGLANYHFGSKDELYRQILLRRAPAMVADLDAALDAASETGTLKAVFEAYAKPHLARLHDPDAGWRNYIRLAAHTSLIRHRADLVEAVTATYRPVVARYRQAITDHLPDVPPVEIGRAFYIYRMAVLSMTIDAEPDPATNISRSPDNLAALARTLIGLFGGGIATLGDVAGDGE